MRRPKGHSLRRDTEARMMRALAPELSKLVGAVVQPTDINLYPATGYWRQKRADVMQFTGNFPVGVGSLRMTLGCWESMTDCLRYGFTVEDSRGNRRAYASFEIAANPPKTMAVKQLDTNEVA